MIKIRKVQLGIGRPDEVSWISDRKCIDPNAFRLRLIPESAVSLYAIRGNIV